ncbi:deleted in malignant brain tumors 1 protein-like, partial [Dendronephthya gigantea]|uniref:deleted in malignant brain tumors 1 protein-like n=1 Tax=Dendronephthya gigantea TaxID=151771 RepID=UPI00106D77AE
MLSYVFITIVIFAVKHLPWQCKALDVPVRLKGPSSENGTGRVEVFYNGTWGTICDDGWDFKDAKVVCRQLGYLDAVRFLEGGQVPSGSGQIWLDGVGCFGVENSISKCYHHGWGIHDCTHSEDAGVECIKSATNLSVRLQGPLSENGTGRVEVFYHGLWGTICDYGWDFRDARVVCRQLGHLDAVRILQREQVPPNGSGQIWLEDVSCTGKEKVISRCSHRGWGINYCTHSEDAGVECIKTASSVSVRLQGPSSENGTGRVEVFYNRLWGTICDDGWDFRDARVVCRQLGYPDAVSSLQGGQVPSGSGQIWLADVRCTGKEENISGCSHSELGINNCGHSKDAGVECSKTATNVSVRLRGPSSESGLGRVEVFYNETWGTICDDGWDFRDARVVCRQLGYSDAIRSLQGGEVPSGSGQIWLDDVSCKGKEENISRCYHHGWGIDDCDHSEDAGVECSKTATNVSIRLRGPSSESGLGRVEVFYNETWGTICQHGWDFRDARVVCRQLGYSDAIRSLQWWEFPSGSGQIWLDDLRCEGEEKNILRCSHRGWGIHDCDHSEDAGVECSKTAINVSVRLQGPLSENGTGRVEVFYNGIWGTICDDEWDFRDAKVVCRQLGYPDAVSSLQREQVPSGSGQIWLADVRCTGKEKVISRCSHFGWGINFCSHWKDAGVECSKTATNVSIRLRGPSSESGLGRVEVFYDETWGTICGYGWDFRDARVVCRQLGYSDAIRSLQGWEVPSGSGQIWLTDVRCSGKEENISRCSHRGWGINNCYHSQDAGVECIKTAVNVSVRLQGPSSESGTGRVEVFYNGQWGTICDHGWDFRDARVVCRQLGYPDAVSSLQREQVPSGSGQMWLADVRCTGKEKVISRCLHLGWGINYCSHWKDAGVECSKTATNVSIRLRGPSSESGLGRVEVFYDETWGTICDYGWDFRDARVVCRQLGYSDAIRSLQKREVPSGSGQIWLADVRCTGKEENISRCSHRGWGINNCYHSNDAGVECSKTATNVSIRLQGPSSESGLGRVEVFYDETWGTICDDGWDFRDARVVCRQLGYSDAIRSLKGGQVPSGSGQIWLDEVTCKGKEKNISRCSHRGWGINNCYHSKDAGVECIKTAINVSVRIQGPLSENGIGRVEVSYNGVWGTICDNGWDFRDARVVCRQLGYLDAVGTLQREQVPSGSGRIWLEDVGCTGKEKVISKCSHLGWGISNYYCSHWIDAGVECSKTATNVSIRLRGPSSESGLGRVEVFYDETWGTICDDGWDFRDARVVCRQLGYSDAIRSLQGREVPSGSGQIWLDDVRCTGEEENISRCSRSEWGINNCDHSKDAGVECSKTGMLVSVRLQGPNSAKGIGRVEVFYNGQWGTICDNEWDMRDTRVVCRQLGYQYAVRHFHWRQDLPGSERIWLDDVTCNGEERNIISCSHNGWGNHNCVHSQDVGIECTNTASNVSVRLQGPSSKNGTGRVEVFYNGLWGTICDDGWDFRDAKVLCRQLGYPDAVRSLQGGQVPSGSGQIWLADVRCTGKEKNISTC